MTTGVSGWLANFQFVHLFMNIRLALSRWKPPKTQYIKDSRLGRDANATEPAVPGPEPGLEVDPDGGAQELGRADERTAAHNP